MAKPLRWSEKGGPPVEPPTRRGFGSRVMENMIRGPLKGQLHFDWHPEGLACEIAYHAAPKSILIENVSI